VRVSPLIREKLAVSKPVNPRKETWKASSDPDTPLHPHYALGGSENDNLSALEVPEGFLRKLEHSPKVFRSSLPVPEPGDSK
jgi:hypothetical protein